MNFLLSIVELYLYIIFAKLNYIIFLYFISFYKVYLENTFTFLLLSLI